MSTPEDAENARNGNPAPVSTAHEFGLNDAELDAWTGLTNEQIDAFVFGTSVALRYQKSRKTRMSNKTFYAVALAATQIFREWRDESSRGEMN